jgi:carotenoid 1,2-hydratase
MLQGIESNSVDAAPDPAAAGREQPVLSRDGSPDFGAAVPENGYRWWYLDAFSNDGRCGLTLIAFIGSVFSPYYAAARRRGPSPAEQFCSMNVILYGPRRKRWAMTERGARALQRDARTLTIGPSSLVWDGATLEAIVDEVTVPIPGRLRGRIGITLPRSTGPCYPLDAAGQHRWWPAAPRVGVRVAMDSPGLAWEGSGYFDCNAGTVPLESSFRGWHWCRAAHADGGCTVLYNTEPRDGGVRRLALRFDPGGSVRKVPAPREVELPATRVWRVHRRAGSEPGEPATVHETFEDTPFYGRSKLGLNLGGERVICMHESLDLDRFDRRWVQTLLPFRMPRRA